MLELEVKIEQLNEADSTEELLKPDLAYHLGNLINSLIINDFPRLVHILRRLDISEQKLRENLVISPSHNAGNLIAQLIIERQIQKILTREELSTQQTDGEHEAW